MLVAVSVAAKGESEPERKETRTRVDEDRKHEYPFYDVILHAAQFVEAQNLLGVVSCIHVVLEIFFIKPYHEACTLIPIKNHVEIMMCCGDAFSNLRHQRHTYSQNGIKFRAKLTNSSIFP